MERRGDTDTHPVTDTRPETDARRVTGPDGEEGDPNAVADEAAGIDADAPPDTGEAADAGAGAGAATDADPSPDGDEATDAAPGGDRPERVHTPDPVVGDVVIRADLAGTALFGVTAALAAVFFTTFWQWIAAVTAMALFAVGVFAFLWSYYNAVQRSRTDAISVTGLYLLLGTSTPARVRRVMLLTLTLQLLIAVVTTFARSHSNDGSPGTSLALGFLVPMFGFGLNGLWAAYHADFPRR